MPKNIVIYSDGTGQDSGLRLEQRISNLFKLYRATRPGPDCAVDPREEMVFYHPALGTETGATGFTSLRRAATRLLSSVAGRGITTNIAGCYEFILNHHAPGDRIWLFGFSCGTYTVRSVADMLRLCGVPTTTPRASMPWFLLGMRDGADKP